MRLQPSVAAIVILIAGFYSGTLAVRIVVKRDDGTQYYQIKSEILSSLDEATIQKIMNIQPCSIPDTLEPGTFYPDYPQCSNRSCPHCEPIPPSLIPYYSIDSFPQDSGQYYSNKPGYETSNKPGNRPSNKPGFGSNKPGIGSNKPEIGSNKPGIISNRPGTGSNKPGIGSRPGLGSNKPGVGNIPGIGSNRPGFGSYNPGIGSNKPGIGSNRPGIGIGSNKPGSNKPGYGSSVIDTSEEDSGYTTTDMSRPQIEVERPSYIPGYSYPNLGTPQVEIDTPGYPGYAFPDLGQPQIETNGYPGYNSYDQYYGGQTGGNYYPGYSYGGNNYQQPFYPNVGVPAHCPQVSPEPPEMCDRETVDKTEVTPFMCPTVEVTKQGVPLGVIAEFIADGRFCKTSAPCPVSLSELVLRVSLLEDKLRSINRSETRVKIYTDILAQIRLKVQDDPMGKVGAPGATGYIGMRGQRGPRGPGGKCTRIGRDQNLAGPKGPQGPKGAPGQPGVKKCNCDGEDGAPGFLGYSVPGVIGPKGHKGQTGYQTTDNTAAIQ